MTHILRLERDDVTSHEMDAPEISREEVEN